MMVQGNRLRNLIFPSETRKKARGGPQFPSGELAMRFKNSQNLKKSHLYLGRKLFTGRERP